MGRVSLTEDYDDRSVIAKLNEMDKRVTENTTVVTAAEASAQASAQAAQETADRFAGSVGAVVQNANAQINASKAQVDQAKAEVDATVTTVAQAVQTANNASASAQQSATTVATYDDRLTATETKNTQQDTAISTLQTADTHNVKLEGNQSITGTKTFTVTRTKNSLETKGDIPPQQRQTQPVQVIDRNDEQVMFDQLLTNTDGTRQYRTNLFAVNGTRVVVENIFLNADGTGYSSCVNPSANAPSSATVNKKYVESTDGETNNLVHRTANEKVNGIKEFAYNTDKHIGTHITTTSGYWVKLIKWTDVSLRYNVVMTVLSPYFRDTNFYGKLMFGCWDKTNFDHLDLISPYNWANRFKVTYDGTEIALWYNNTSGEYKLGINVFIDIECNGTDKSSRAILIPESEQVAENPDWSSFARVLDGTYRGWGA